MVYFLDSSAVAKRYVAELGSAWVIQLLDPAHWMTTEESRT